MKAAILWELDKDGQECECTCPSCGLGLCVCSIASRFMLSDAWAAAKPPGAELGLEVQLPRSTSSARAAGFMKDDVVIAVDDQPVKSTAIVQKTIRDHRPNERIQFDVRRRGDLISVNAERWSDLGVEADENLDDCVVPAGTEFFVDQARQAQNSSVRGLDLGRSSR